MKIVPKLTTVLVAGMCVVLGINGYLRVRRETATFQEERARRHRRAASTISAAMANAWQMQDEAAAISTMEAIATGYTTMRIRWIPSVTESASPDPSTRVDRTLDPPTWSTHVPVFVDGRPRGELELLEPTTADEENARNVLAETIKTAAALALLSAVIAFFVGHWVVGKPVRELAAKARRIGRGDFGEPLHVRSSDELAELASEMNSMSQRLVTTLEQLRHADRLATVGKLASGVAHELGTPLNVVTARAEMIVSLPDATPESRDYANAIRRAAERMTAIIAQLLQFARRKTVARARHDVGALVRDAVDLLRPLARKRQVRVDLEAADVSALVDAGQLQQVVTNLVMNAIQASREGGRIFVKVHSSREVPPADIGGPPCDAICIAVEDEGSGIRSEDLQRIFEPFFTTKEVGDGTGLGLAVTHGIVREHQGWIDVASDVGVGSTFRVILPVGAGA